MHKLVGNKTWITPMRTATRYTSELWAFYGAELPTNKNPFGANHQIDNTLLGTSELYLSVRNPYDRFVSFFNHIESLVPYVLTFEEYIGWISTFNTIYDWGSTDLAAEIPTFLATCREAQGSELMLFKPQSVTMTKAIRYPLPITDFVTQAGIPLARVNHIIHTETLDVDLEAAGFKKVPEVVNTYKTETRVLTAQQKTVIARLYAADFANFGYLI